MPKVSSSSTFLRLALLTTALTYLLVSVGAIVRVTGAGMGCPDWPTCFGLLVPPTSVDELPPLGSYDYPPGWRVESFDPVMTWIEYVNRLLGALVGLAIFATLVAALATPGTRRKKAVVVPTVLAFFGVGYAGWLGARVVAHELAPWIVTAHLLSAIGVVSCLVVAVVNASQTEGEGGDAALSFKGWGVALLALLQGSVGTQVRGTLEDIARAHPELARDEWLAQLGTLNFVHTALGLLVGVAVVFFVFSVRTARPGTRAATAAGAAAILVGGQLLTGVVLGALGLPRVAQVLHLLLGALLLGTLTATAMLLRRKPA